MEYKEFEGKSVDEAIVAAMRSFRVSFEELDIQVLAEGSKGLFGLGGKLAKIKARLSTGETDELEASDDLTEEEEASAANESPVQTSAVVEAPRQVLEEMQGILAEILKNMNMPNEIKLRDDGVLEVIGDGSGLLIGKHGQTLDALQFVLNRIANKNREEPVHVSIDTEKYRERHIEHLRSIALKMGEKAKRTGRSVSLEKMNPYDRRIIHLALKNEAGINTKSIGEGVFKKVVIVPRKASR
jgi:spoIIIJ-associated protein